MAPVRPLARRVGRKLWLVLKVAGGAVLALTAAGALVLHLDLPVTRRLVARATNRVLLPVFRGRLTIEHLGRLGLDGVDGARARVFDPAGQLVLVADGIHARIATWKLVRSLLASPMTVDVDISDAVIDHVDLLIDTDPEGVPLLARAFTPQPSASALPRKAPPSVVVVISQAKVRQAWVHGQPTWGPAIDLDLRDVDAKVLVQSERVTVDVRRATLAARGLPLASDGMGDLHGRVVVPSEHGNPVGIDGAF